MNEYYGSDLAFIHDDGFGGFARQAARELLSLFSKSGIEEGTVVDLGCGSGIWAEILLERGYQVHGIDISSSMIELARKRAPDATFHLGSFLDADIPPCNAVTAMGETLNYLFDDAHSDTQLNRLFSRIFDALKPGGLFVFDVAGLDYAKAMSSGKRHFSTEDWAVLVHLAEHKRERLATRYITTFLRNEDDLYERSEESHRIRLLEGAVLARSLRDIGFRVRLRKGYGSFKLSPAHHVVIARKP